MTPIQNFTSIINDSSELGYIHESASRKKLSYIDKMKIKIDSLIGENNFY